jgi:tagatose-6-phosphate ketose/aldose isomerase
LANITSNVLSLEVPSTVPDAYRPPVDIIFGQLLGLFTSLANDMLPDSPSAGAIGRVVSHVKIYPALAERKS